MNDLKKEIINVLEVIEESINLNCPDDEKKLDEIARTKDYIINNLNNKNDKVE